MDTMPPGLLSRVRAASQELVEVADYLEDQVDDHRLVVGITRLTALGKDVTHLAEVLSTRRREQISRDQLQLIPSDQQV